MFGVATIVTGNEAQFGLTVWKLMFLLLKSTSRFRSVLENTRLCIPLTFEMFDFQTIVFENASEKSRKKRVTLEHL